MDTMPIQKQMHHEMETQEIFDQAVRYAFAYMEGIARRPVYPDEKALAGLDRFDEPLPEKGCAASEVVSLLDQAGAPATVAQTGGRYFGFVNGGVIPAALAARWMADAWDQNPALYVISPVAGRLEQVCERWLADLLGLPADTAAGLVSGSSTATFCGLAAARYEILRRQGWDVNALGLFNAPPVRVVVSDQAHSSVFKALALLGLGRERVETVPADGQGRIDPERIPALDDRCILLLQAGNVNTGAFDAFDAICDRAEGSGAWIHVDGAFGLWARASEGKNHLVRGMERADSWSADGHKTLNTPYDCGIVLCRHRPALTAAMQARGDYIHYSDQRDGMLTVPEMSRRARAVDLWAALKYLGRNGVGALVDGMCLRAGQFAAGLAQENFRILNDVVFNQVLVACDTPERTRQTLARIQAGGVCWCGGTLWQGEPAIRISVSSWRTTKEDVDRCVEDFVHARSTG